MNQPLHHLLDRYSAVYSLRAPELPPIASIGIPTRDRPDSLRRCLKSYIENTRRFDRDVQFIVVDDSRDPESINQTHDVVQNRHRVSGCAVALLDREWRHGWAEQLARTSGLPAGLVRFALLGDDRCPTSYGASRNTLLLATAGQRTIQVDDDTVCRITSTATDGGKTIELTSRHEVGDYRFFESREEAVASSKGEDGDFVGLQERLLGHHPCSVLARYDLENRKIDSVQETFIENLVRPEARILKTFLGVRGDSGMRNSLNRLLLKGPSFETLAGDPAAYEWKLRTREILRSSTHMVIGNTYAMQTINLGLDNTTTLPPFPPVLRNEDGVFGAMISLCWPAAFNGYPPGTLHHVPLPPREAKNHLTPSATLVNDILLGVLASFSTGMMGDDGVVNSGLTGMYLAELSAQTLNDFRHYITQVGQRIISNLLDEMRRILEVERDGPLYWRKDFDRLMTDYERIANDPGDFFLPTDVEGSPGQRLSLTQDLFARYAELLKYWPRLTMAAAQSPLSPSL